jgi:hypothetical protein
MLGSLLLVLGLATAPPGTVRVEVFVPLCDGAALGCGGGGLGDPHVPTRNLYWGAQFGNDRMLRAHPDWRLTQTQPAAGCRLLTQTYVHHAQGSAHAVTAVLHAYDGTCMSDALEAWLRAVNGSTQADLVVWAGHDGLMDVDAPKVVRGQGVPVVALSCLSNRFMAGPILAAGGRPLVMTQSLMAPEGYLLLALLQSVARHGVPAAQRHLDGLVEAYARYQHITPRAARRVFVAPP